MEEARELILLPALRARRGQNGGLVVTRKYMAGAAEFARFWPGKVTTLFALQGHATTDMDQEEFMPGAKEHADGPAIELRPEVSSDLAARLSSAALVMAFLSREEGHLVEMCKDIGLPVVLISEYSPRTERQILWAEVSNPLVRLRRLLWLWRTEQIRRKMLRQAAGLQCSGTPTYGIYRDLCHDTFLFFDNRVRGADVIDDDALASRLEAMRGGRPLRLIFGGRLVAMKGVMDLPELADRLRAFGIPFSLDIYGSGPLEPALAARIRTLGLGDRVSLRGVLDFETGWIPTLRDNVDLFVCCHPQGDPSSTYVEVMSCGVPIVGYDNEAFAGVLELSEGGWSAPVGAVETLARQIARLHEAREEIEAAAWRARDFARRHNFEVTFAARTAHLVRNSRLPADVKAMHV